MLEKFVPVDVVADKFSVSKHTVRQWLRKGKIPTDMYVKIGNTYRYNLKGIENTFLSTNKEYKCGADFDVKEFNETIGDTMSKYYGTDSSDEDM